MTDLRASAEDLRGEVAVLVAEKKELQVRAEYLSLLVSSHGGFLLRQQREGFADAKDSIGVLVPETDWFMLRGEVDD